MSKIGIKMMRANGSKLLMTSLGTAPYVRVAAWDVKLLLIWLYLAEKVCRQHACVFGHKEVPTVNQYKGYHRKMTHALKPRLTSSIQTSLGTRIIHFGLSSPLYRLG